MWWQATERVRRVRALHGLFKSDRRKDRPEARGLRLLRAWLSPEQRAQFDAFGHFDVRGSVTGKKYRIHFGISANVQEIGEDGRAGGAVETPLGSRPCSSRTSSERRARSWASGSCITARPVSSSIRERR